MKNADVPSVSDAEEGGTASLDQFVRHDGPVFRGLRSLYGSFDSKDLADLCMRLPIRDVLTQFSNLPPNAPKEKLEALARDCFYDGFPDVVEWVPPDIPKSTLSWLKNSRQDAAHQATELREEEFLGNMLALWAALGRKTECTYTPAVLNSREEQPQTEQPQRQPIISSLIPLPFGFIIPGGRFREMYYWDSYWTIRGLLYSGMRTTARGMILNFSDLIKRFGFIPNGTRSYYLTRSQPPVFSMMIAAYYSFTGDTQFIRETYSDMEQEYLYWIEDPNRKLCGVEGGWLLGYWEKCGRIAVSGVLLCRFAKGSTLCLSRYLGHIALPRTESWLCDVKAASHIDQEDTSASISRLFRSIRAAAESGWDFSSRWVSDSADLADGGVMEQLNTEAFIPVDLNSFLYHTELCLFYFGEILKQLGADRLLPRQPKPPCFFLESAEARRRAMLRLLWNEKTNWWFDFDVSKGRQSRRVTAAGVIPFRLGIHCPPKTQARQLFGAPPCCPSGSFDRKYVSISSSGGQGSAQDAEETAARLCQAATARFLVSESQLWKPWGLSTTQLETSEQWDGPNCWPPLLQMAVEGIVHYGQAEELQKAAEMSDRYLLSCKQAYEAFGALPEKFNSLFPGSCGGGGNYTCQKGFGWSIGVAVELLFFKQCNFMADEIQKRRRQFGANGFN
ncbi:hypothetical protein cyc_01116 [Cyclospora cayetanensis]|uniref:Trehalase n=1 Tax=Cyclospora cayetanensis TaxID=88456 RepID=A0A1D3CYK2_9EIME|nr:hypothetical protein cyc_01116 [Cyclospora cayetanensis]